MAGHRDQISLAMDLLAKGLQPFIEKNLRAKHGAQWTKVVASSFRDDRGRVREDSVDWDAQSLLTVMWDQWNAQFRGQLGHFERSLVSELREFRNRWAHQQNFDFDDAYRVLDSVQRLLTAIHSPERENVVQQKSYLLESHVADEVNQQVQKTRFNRNKWWVIAIYSFCCIGIIAQSVDALTRQNLTMFVIVFSFFPIFLYMIYQQFKLETPLLYGPRECRRCNRIIYRQDCPYCKA